jgi:hypothetical protein
MGCLPPSQVAAIKAAIAKLDALIDAAYTAYTAALTNSEIETYRFDSGEGSQRADRRAPAEIREEIENLEAARNRLARKLAGTSNTTINWRRRNYRGYGRYHR